MRLSTTTLPTSEVTLPVQPTKPRPRVLVTADGEHLVSHAGSLLLAETADTVGLTDQLGRRANLGVRAGAHDRGAVLRDLLVMLADGGDGFGDLVALRHQPELFGQVASVPTAWRVVAGEVAGDPRGVAALWSALARARETAWGLGAAPPGPLVLDLDATLLTAHSGKQGAAPTFKRGFGSTRWPATWTAGTAPGRP
jgi:Transposase DDE domain group 1